LNKAGIAASAIHGNKSQGARTKALADFKADKISVLVATDIAARGIDIEQLPYVVNLDLPNISEDYVHRIGRTGRAGQDGIAISLVCADEVESLSSIEHLIGHLLPREELEGFEASHVVPETSMARKTRVKKPKVENSSRPQSHNARVHQNRRNNSFSKKPKTGVFSNVQKKSSRARNNMK